LTGAGAGSAGGSTALGGGCSSANAVTADGRARFSACAFLVYSSMAARSVSTARTATTSAVTPGLPESISWISGTSEPGL
jgi:hypothetical protein